MNKIDLLKTISVSFQKYQEYGARSTQKLKPLHTFVAEAMATIWGEDYELRYLGEETKELTVDGKYYPKNIDICITKKGKPVFCIGIKFITSNYKQNANNYFENMMGETANIQANNIPYAQFIILRKETPYYKKSNADITDKKASKIEIIDKGDLQKYVNLMYDNSQAHRPFATAIVLVDINENTAKAAFVDLSKAFEKDFAKLLTDKLSVENFAFEVENYKRFFQTKKTKK